MTMDLSPGVYIKETDLSEVPAAVATSIGAIVGAFERGTLDIGFCSSQQGFIAQYGKPNLAYGFAGHSAFYFMDEATQLMVKRVVSDDADYALGFFANNELFDNTLRDTVYMAVPAGMSGSYKEPVRQVQDLIFSAALVTSNQFNVSLNASAISAVTFTTSSDNTMALIAAAIQTTLNGLGAGGKVSVVAFTGGNNRIIRIVSPEGVSVAITSAAVTAGASQANVAVRNTKLLFWTYAENPGKWANDVRVAINNLDQGYLQRIRLTFSAALVASNSITGTLTVTDDDGNITQYTIGPVVFSSSNDVTIAAFAAAIQSILVTNYGGGTATVTAVAGATTNDREIIVVAPNASLGDIAITGVTVTLGASQATVVVKEIVKRIAPTGLFDLEVYEKTATPTERISCTLEDYVDGMGDQKEIGYVVNEGPYKSPRIRVVKNEAYTGARVLNNLTDTTFFLTGGDDGAVPGSDKVIAGWDDFASPSKVTVRLLINGGYATPEVHQAMTALAAKRRDCHAILDMPSDRQGTAQLAGQYRTQELNIDDSHASIYMPDVLVRDTSLGKNVYVPPSGFMAAQYAFTDRNRAEYFAAAGLNRGQVKRARGLRFLYEEGDLDFTCPLQINSIIRQGSRYVTWGDYTLQVKRSRFQSTPVRRLFNSIYILTLDTVAYSLWEPNDEATRALVESRIRDFLEPMRRNRGINRFQVVCNDKNNTPPVQDLRKLRVQVLVDANMPLIFGDVDLVATKTGASFDEVSDLLLANGSTT